MQQNNKFIGAVTSKWGIVAALCLGGILAANRDEITGFAGKIGDGIDHVRSMVAQGTSPENIRRALTP